MCLRASEPGTVGRQGMLDEGLQHGGRSRRGGWLLHATSEVVGEGALREDW